MWCLIEGLSVDDGLLMGFGLLRDGLCWASLFEDDGAILRSRTTYHSTSMSSNKAPLQSSSTHLVRVGSDCVQEARVYSPTCLSASSLAIHEIVVRVSSQSDNRLLD